ncbi:zinc finger protein 667 isoform X12 [Agrilus planipennis]|uniref:Zinc finger protein 667 isoform X12 n=1 Tax=Agrilus planipennis TaxID=224129 RepID=A0A1W4XGS3_AGRPL|nr:zinc finger protein 667 isoform X12 [Agrilus planipennis]
MVNSVELMQLCRLCLVKDEVNIPIFDNETDVQQIFLKISTCLPVKVTQDDNLPKKICNDCSYKLDLCYQFWNTSANSEKQLVTWLNEVGLSQETLNEAKLQKTESNSTPGLVLKQETIEPESESSHEVVNNVSTESQEYILQQQQLPYQTPAFPFTDDNFVSGESANAGASKTHTNNKRESTLKRKRQAVATVTQPDSDDDVDEDIDDPTETKVAKTEETSDDDRDDDGLNDEESTEFAGVPSTSTDNEQPGPSGIGKNVVDAPLDDHLSNDYDQETSQSGTQMIYECEICTQIFGCKKEFLKHHVSKIDNTFNCCRCHVSFYDTNDLYEHYDVHKNDPIVISENEFDCTENIEAVMNIPNEESINDSSSNELLYILDDSQCVNEVVIDEVSELTSVKQENSSSKHENSYAIVQFEHGYVLPKLLKEQIDPKRKETVRKEGPFVTVKTQKGSKNETSLLIKRTAGTPRLLQPKRRHEMPDFSATNYIILNPNEEVDIPHFKCLRCEQLFINKFVFFRHVEKGKCFVNTCDVCSATFNKNSEFYNHYIIEHTDRAICNFCFRTFMYEKNVKEHMLRHLDQFRHRCEECNKGFYTIREYRNHYKNRHMGIRHKCEVCGRSFADEYYFKRHVATHIKALH